MMIIFFLVGFFFNIIFIFFIIIGGWHIWGVVLVVVFLWGGIFVFLWWCFCGDKGIFVMVFLNIIL